MLYQNNNLVPKPISINQYHNRPKIIFHYCTPSIKLKETNTAPLVNPVNQALFIQKHTYSYPRLSNIVHYPLSGRIPIINNQYNTISSKSPTSKSKRLKIFDRNYSNNHLFPFKNQYKPSRWHDNAQTIKDVKTKSISTRKRKIFSQSLQSKEKKKQNKIKKQSIKQKKQKINSRRKYSPDIIKIQNSYTIKQNKQKQKQATNNIDKYRIRNTYIQDNKDRLKRQSRSTNSQKQIFNNSSIVINIENEYNSDNSIMQQKTSSNLHSIKNEYLSLNTNLQLLSKVQNHQQPIENKDSNKIENINHVKAIKKQSIVYFNYLPAIIIILGFIIFLIQVVK